MAALSPGPADYERALAAAGVLGVTVFHRETTGSTNDDAKAISAGNQTLMESATAIVVAEAQTRGRGRGSNAWFSPLGSIALTITVPGVEVSRLSVLPLGVGAAVVKALRHLGAPAQVKWPNDVMIGGAKVGGILCESSLLLGTARVFIGIGINVEPAAVDPAILGEATTLGDHGISASRPELVADITARVLNLIRGSDPGARIVEGWKAVSIPWWGEEVTLQDGESRRRVILLDVNPEGQLVVRDEGGSIRSLVSGEVRQVRVASR